MRVVAYYRVSSSKQRDRDTIAGQRAEVRALCAAHGWVLVAEYEDDGRSARKGLSKRTGLAAALAAVRAGDVDAVVFVALDRLSRAESLRERGEILDAFQETGSKIVVSGGRLIDLSTFGGRIEVNLLLELAAEESAEKARRTKRGRARAVAEGRPPARVPLGYRHDKEAHRVDVDAERSELVIEAFERVSGGASCETVAGHWQHRGIATSTGKGKGRWTNGMVVRLIRRDCYYTGKWAANNGAVIDVPVLITPELAAAARAQLDRSRKAALRRTKHEYLLEGLARCTCGAPITITGVWTDLPSGRRWYRYYRCDRQRHPKLYEGKCALRGQRTEAADARVWEEVRRWLDDPGLVEEGLARLGGAATEQGRQALADLEDARRQLAKQEEAARVLTLALEHGDLGADLYAERIAVIGRRRRMLEDQVRTWGTQAGEAQAEAESAEALRAGLDQLRARAAGATFEERRKIVRGLCPTGFEFLPDGRIVADAILGLATRAASRAECEHKTEIPVRRKLIA